MLEEKFISNLYDYLMNTKEDEIIVRTTYVKGGWYDNEIDAHLAKFDIYRFINPVYEERHEFSECYRITRKKGGKIK